MVYTNDHEDINQLLYEFTELLEFTLSNEFIKRWKGKYSIKFLKLFQTRLMKSMSDRRPLKITTLYTFLTKKCYYSKEQVFNFFDSIDITIYSPLIKGNRRDI
tara:strand:+ start:133 stop:441 length:309 start_codon:yes stop_codon:yes gene_type:complete